MKSPEWKQHLSAAYDRHACERERMEKQDWKEIERAHFHTRLQQEGAVSLLEIGAGTGRDSLFFAQTGYEVTSSDLSPRMVQLCREKGLQAEVMDFYKMTYPDGRFDAVYALNCLLHVPKADIVKVLLEIRRVLRPGGLFYMGVYGGPDSEGVWEEDAYEPKRFFSFYTDRSVQDVVGSFLEPVYFRVIPLAEGKPHFQSMIWRKPPRAGTFQIRTL
ncbi:class I SAM-dependent methyltransferase [Paenibacillus sp. y28]|uniref:class I SAM-dependent methyltransferase n=1 Tax=Paenibacillus sp. y28 TaxID=3129110 RepID=UPI003017EDA1